MGHCSFSATASPGITRPVQSAHVWTGRTVSAIRSKTTAHSLVKKSSLSDAAIRLLASANGTGVNGKGSLCYSITRPPPTHWTRRPPCQMRLSDFSSVQAAQVRAGQAVSAIRSKTTVHWSRRPPCQMRLSDLTPESTVHSKMQNP